MLIADKLSRLLANGCRTDLAASLKITREKLNKVLGGHVRPSVKLTMALAVRFDVCPLWMLDDARDWPPVQLSSALAIVDRPGLDDATRARHALHRCIDLLDGAALMRVVVFTNDAMAASVAAARRGRTEPKYGRRDRLPAVSAAPSGAPFGSPDVDASGGFFEDPRGPAAGRDHRCLPGPATGGFSFNATDASTAVHG